MEWTHTYAAQPAPNHLHLQIYHPCRMRMPATGRTYPRAPPGPHVPAPHYAALGRTSLSRRKRNAAVGGVVCNFVSFISSYN